MSYTKPPDDPTAGLSYTKPTPEFGGAQGYGQTYVSPVDYNSYEDQGDNSPAPYNLPTMADAATDRKYYGQVDDLGLPTGPRGAGNFNPDVQLDTSQVIDLRPLKTWETNNPPSHPGVPDAWPDPSQRPAPPGGGQAYTSDNGAVSPSNTVGSWEPTKPFNAHDYENPHDLIEHFYRHVPGAIE